MGNNRSNWVDELRSNLPWITEASTAWLTGWCFGGVVCLLLMFGAGGLVGSIVFFLLMVMCATQAILTWRAMRVGDWYEPPETAAPLDDDK